MNANYFILFSFFSDKFRRREHNTCLLFRILPLSSTSDPMATPYRFLLYPALCKMRDDKGGLASNTIVLGLFHLTEENGGTLVTIGVSN